MMISVRICCYPRVQHQLNSHEGMDHHHFIHDPVNLMKLRKFEIHLSMCEGRDEHVPSCVRGGQYSQEGPDPEIVDGG
jgi:hypothetical protein